MAKHNMDTLNVRDQKKRRRVTAFAVTAALLLIAGSVVTGGSIAWLIAQPREVVNIFTYGDVQLKLEETDTKLDKDDDPNTNMYEMIPGEELTKDPKVIVEKDSLSNWLFVKLERTENFDEFFGVYDDKGQLVKDQSYEMADGWTLLEIPEDDSEDGDDNEEKKELYEVYYRIVKEDEVSEKEQEFQILKDDKLTVKESVTKEMLNALDMDEDGNELEEKLYPKLTVTAYGVQYAGFEPMDEEGEIIEEPTDEELNAAALKAWEAVEVHNKEAEKESE